MHCIYTDAITCPNSKKLQFNMLLSWSSTKTSLKPSAELRRQTPVALTYNRRACKLPWGRPTEALHTCHQHSGSQQPLTHFRFPQWSQCAGFINVGTCRYFLSPLFQLLWSAKTARVMNGDTALKRTKVISLMHWEEWCIKTLRIKTITLMLDSISRKQKMRAVIQTIWLNN